MIQKKQLAVAVAATFVASGFASAQSQTPQRVERVEVTGSNIKRVDTETAAPIQVITADEIRRSGKTTVTELLRELPINAAGGLTELTGSGSFSAGAASASLRGLGSTATLVLLNGRRVTAYGLADPNFGQSGAVNLNAIPLAVVERIDILKDGASAIYGSEAIAGVINIILRKDFTGARAGIGGSMNSEGQYGTANATASFGFGDLGRDRYNVFGNVEVYRQGATSFKDTEDFLNRQQFRDVYLTGVASSSFSPAVNFLRPGASSTTVFSTTNLCAAGDRLALPAAANGFGSTTRGELCLYDQWKYVYITPKAERINGFVRGTFNISTSLEAFAELSYNDSSTFFPGTPRAVGNGVGGTFSAATGRLNNIPTSLPTTNPYNPTFGTATPAAVPFRYRFDVLGPQDNAVDSGVFRGLVGLKGYVGGWDFETGLLHNDSRVTTINYNEVNLPLLTQGIINGTFNFLNPNAGAIKANDLRINAVDESKSVTSIFDLKGSRELFSLPGGPASIAVGAEYRREERVLDPDIRKQNGEILGRGVARADSSRNVRTLYAELSAPIVKGLEVQLAGRHDRYSDYGNSTTPKVAIAYSPTSSLKVRGSYAEGFRAPSLVEAGRSATSGFFNNVDDPRRCNRAAGVTAGCGSSIPGLITGSSFLKAEDAESYTLGFVFEPSNELNLSVDYFNIKRRNEITFLSLDEILRNEGSADPRFANRIFRDPANVAAGVPNDPGAILYVLSGFDNLGKTEVSGIDFDVRRRFSLGSMGKLTSRLTATHYITQGGSGTPTDPVVSYNGMRNAPRTRAQFTNSWEYGAWTSTLTFNYLSSFRPYSNPVFSGTAQTTCANPNGTYLGVCNVSEYYTFDLGVEYSGIKNLRVNLTARNIANRKPSFDPIARPFNVAWYSPAGLTFVGGMNYTFR